MPDVKWIKLTTAMFDDEKIRLIESMPDRDTILIVWIKLLVQAGKTNASGYIFLNENIPYTGEMLATIFNRPLNTIRLALDTFEKFGMIEREEKGIYITNWEKYQNIEGMEKIREQNRLRKQKQREQQKLEEGQGHVTSRDSHATDIELELDKEKDIKDLLSSGDDSSEKNILKDDTPSQKPKTDPTPIQEIINDYNTTCTSFPKVKVITEKRKRDIRARWKKYHDVGTYRKLFQMAEESDFLSGRNGKWGGCTFDWLMNENNMVKVLEESYPNEKTEDKSRAAPYRRSDEEYRKAWRIGG